jgi:hypothetical protein
MKRSGKSGPVTALALCLIGQLVSMPAASAAQQRATRSRSRQPASSTLVAAGTQVLPAGTVLILRLETRLDSGSSRASDRFTTRLSDPVMDTAGRVLVPAGSIVEGYLTSVTPAQLRRRSGIIAVSFDKLRLPDGRGLALHGELTSADARERQRIDEEGNVTGGSTVKRSIVFIGGGAASGAVIGAITGGAAIGAGVGAAAGAVAALLAKGKEAVVERGTRLGMRLLQPLDLRLGASGLKPIEEEKPMPEEAAQPPDDAVPVRISSVQAERMPDGSVHVLITAETSTAGWRLYTEHVVERETLVIQLRGVRPKGMAAQVISHPTASLSVRDESGAIRRVTVHGANGTRTVEPRS